MLCFLSDNTTTRSLHKVMSTVLSTGAQMLTITMPSHSIKDCTKVYSVTKSLYACFSKEVGPNTTCIKHAARRHNAPPRLTTSRDYETLVPVQCWARRLWTCTNIKPVLGKLLVFAGLLCDNTSASNRFALLVTLIGVLRLTISVHHNTCFVIYQM